VLNRDPRCVFAADTLALADVVAGWLSGQGIPAEVMDDATLGGFEGKTSVTPWVVSNRGIEVWVRDESQAPLAARLVAEKAEEFRAVRTQREAKSGTVEVICEECSRPAVFPASAEGTVQDCPHCGAYLDVPDPDDDWSDVDGPGDDSGEQSA
jgi:ribosomal protein S27E